MKKYLYNKLLPALLKKRCVGNIPRSGEEGKKIDCISIYFKIKNEDNTYFLLKGIRDNTFSGSKIINNTNVPEIELDFDEILSYQLEITRFKGLYQIQYNSIYGALFGEILGITYCRVCLERFINFIKTAAYNQRNIEADKKIEILKYLVKLESEKSINRDGVSLITFLHYKYGFLFFDHPKYKELKRTYQLYFDSLVESLDLQVKGGDYIIKGKAISTIENYNELEMRHKESIRMQKRISWLTFFLVLIGILQSGIIKISPLIDLSKINFLSRM